jgi:hypothetical protein
MERGKAIGRSLLTLPAILLFPTMSGDHRHGFAGRLPGTDDEAVWWVPSYPQLARVDRHAPDVPGLTLTTHLVSVTRTPSAISCRQTAFSLAGPQILLRTLLAALCSRLIASRF